jgi:LysR family transcriptional regulator, flagellar master operon regulator
MDISTFQTFLAAADTGSFSMAAQRVNASPSSVTDRIKQLEFRLGTRLFVRDRRGCRLTPAGVKFVAPAQRAVRAWQAARHEVALPEKFVRSLSFGGQYFLWDLVLLDWLFALREALPDLALTTTAGAWARLNRDLAEGILDMVVVHDPLFRTDIGAEPLFADKLVLVTGGDPARWRDHFVRIEWGQSLGLEIASRLDIAPQAGLVLDLGARSAQWLEHQRMAGYLPGRVAKPLVDKGQLRLVEDAPRFDFPAYVCWRRDCDADLVSDVIDTLRKATAVR